MVYSDKSPEMIIIAGPNGSGKTTITTQFLHHEWAEGISTKITSRLSLDIIFYRKDRQISKW